MATLKQIFAAHLREIRTQRKLTQEQLAESCRLSYRFIRDIELAEKAPSFGTIEKFCKILRVQPHDFFLPLSGAEELSKRTLLTKFKDELLGKIEDLVDRYSK